MTCVFLSSPFSHPNDAIREDRVTAAGNACAWLYRQGHLPMSPIAHWHRIAQRNSLPTEAMAWIEWNRQWVYASDAVVVLELNGWRDSQGIAMEVAWANENETPVWRIRPKGMGNFEWVSDLEPPFKVLSEAERKRLDRMHDKYGEDGSRALEDMRAAWGLKP